MKGTQLLAIDQFIRRKSPAEIAAVKRGVSRARAIDHDAIMGPVDWVMLISIVDEVSAEEAYEIYLRALADGRIWLSWAH